MTKLTRIRIVEIGAALLLTLAAAVVFGLQAWAAGPMLWHEPPAKLARLIGTIPGHPTGH